MSQVSRIQELCDRWVAAVNQPDGSLAIGSASEQYRLLKNGVVIHELSFEELQATIVALNKTLLQPRLNTVIDADHLFLWSWVGELLLKKHILASRSHKFREADQLLVTCVRVALAPARPPVADRNTWELQRRTDELIPFHLRMLGSEVHNLLPYAAFAALEGQLRIGCAAYVDMSGRVLADFVVPGRQGPAVTYGAKAKLRCNSIRDLLLLYVTTMPKAATERIEGIRTHIGSVAASGDGFDVLYDWRNSSLHGEASLPTIGGTVLNLALLIALQQLEGAFESHRAETWKGAEWNIKTSHAGSRSPWSFYPPW